MLGTEPPQGPGARRLSIGMFCGKHIAHSLGHLSPFPNKGQKFDKLTLPDMYKLMPQAFSDYFRVIRLAYCSCVRMEALLVRMQHTRVCFTDLSGFLPVNSYKEPDPQFFRAVSMGSDPICYVKSTSW